MKKPYALFIIISFFYFSALADSYHTITIDGQNIEWTANETFTNISHDGSTNQRAYFTWDADYIYIGIYDSDADWENMATFIYFDTDPTGSNGSTSAYAWGDYITTPFNADYAIVCKNQYGADYIETKKYSTQWDALGSANSLVLDDGNDTLVQFAVGTDYREFRIKRSYIGNPETIKTCMFTEQQWTDNWRYLTWPSNGWTDDNRTSGQSIPLYYGFILNENISQTDYAYFNCKITGFTGDAKSADWNNAANWSNGLPDDTAVVVIPAASIVDVNTSGECYDISNAVGASFTINSTNSLTIHNNLYNNAGSSGFDIESTSSGNSSLIVRGEVDGEITAQCYMTNGQWHSYSAPVTGLTAQDLYLGGNPEVWLAEYDEATKDYTFISAFEEPIGDMKGWMVWVGGSVAQTFSFEGSIRTNEIGSTDNLVRSQSGDYGYNYVGNPFTSAIDWDTTSGWTKTNLNDAIYVFNDGSWSSYAAGVGTNGGSRYIAMNQGFMAQVTEGFSVGTLKMNDSVCVHNNVSYLKNTTSSPDSLIRLQLTMYDKTDETVIRYLPNATEGFDGSYDAHKLMSHSDNRPLIYSTANDFMSINTLPPDIFEIPIDVKGINNVNMTISASEINTIDDVYLKDLHTGEITDLKLDSYTFTYDNTITDRFIITSLLTTIENQPDKKQTFIAYSTGKTITIKTSGETYNTYNIHNIHGQLVSSGSINENISVDVRSAGCYIISLAGNSKASVKKIIIK